MFRAETHTLFNSIPLVDRNPEAARWACSRRPRNLGLARWARARPTSLPQPRPRSCRKTRLDPTPAPSWLSPPPALFRSRRSSWRARRRPLAPDLIFGISEGSGPTRPTKSARTKAGYPESPHHVGTSARNFHCTPGYEGEGRGPVTPRSLWAPPPERGQLWSPVTAGNRSRELERSLTSRAYRSRKAPRYRFWQFGLASLEWGRSLSCLCPPRWFNRFRWRLMLCNVIRLCGCCVRPGSRIAEVQKRFLSVTCFAPVS